MEQTKRLSTNILCIVALLTMASCQTRRNAQQAALAAQYTAPTPATRVEVREVLPAGVSVSSRHAFCNTAQLKAANTWQGKLQRELDNALLSTLFDSTQLSLGVFDLTTDEWIYCVNVQQRMRPGSNMKLVTAISALDVLPSDYSYVPTVVRPGWGWCWDDDETGMRDFSMTGSRKSSTMLYQESREWGLLEVLHPMMKKSDNMLAESMFWQLAPGRSSATRKETAAVVEDVIRKAGLAPSTYTIADGSGLSLYNYTSAELFIYLLRYAHINKVIYNMLYPALPIAGVDGTLSKRMTGTKAQNNVHAKTGTVTGVSTLSGYCTASNGHTLCFSIMNNGLPKAALGRNFQDKICVLLCQ